MDPLTMAAVMGGVGLLQGSQQAKQQAKQMEMQAMQNRYAPLFGQAPGQVGQQSPAALQGLISGGLGGYQQGLNYEMMKNALGAAGGSSTGNDIAMNYQQTPGNMYT